MTLTPEQQQAVASWVAAGDNLSAVQQKLSEQFKLSLTYRDVRFLVDDLDLALKDPAPKVDASDVSKPAAARPGAAEKNVPGPVANGAGSDRDAAADGNDSADEDLGDLPAAGAVRIAVDNFTLIPGALASGTVTFSDGVTGKWIVDNMGRPGFTEVSQPGYRPSPADGQAFMQELSAALQQRGY
jgi:hypothetical protein